MELSARTLVQSSQAGRMSTRIKELMDVDAFKRQSSLKTGRRINFEKVFS